MKAKLKLFATSLFFIMATWQAKAEGEVPGGRVTISGYVKDASNGEVLIGVNIYVAELNTGTVTNTYGFYSVSLQPGKYKVTYSYVGFSKVEKQIELKSNTTMNMELTPISQQLDEVVVTAERPEANVKQPEMSVNKLDNMAIKKVPALMGEVDILKTIQMLPGVLPTAEGTSGFSVRGGNMDQNLIILDEATVYNASHLMGFFSVFNNDAIRDVKLYKGDIPAMYGGRLSSVLDVRMKEGNSKKLAVTGGVGLISSRLTVEGPIGKNQKTSFLISGRRTYADLFFPLMTDTSAKKSILYFYDLNLKVNHQFSDNDKLFLSAYLGRDIFGQKGQSRAGFGNKTATLRWNHQYSSRLFSNLTATAANYDYDLAMKFGEDNYVWKSNLVDYCLKTDFNFYLNPNNEIKFGASATLHFLDPINAYIESDSTQHFPRMKNNEREYAFYLSNQQKIGDKLTVKYGLRYSVFQNVGASTLNHFDDNYNYLGQTHYSKNEIFNTYSGLEPRLGFMYMLNDKSSIKGSYSYTLQYLQLASVSNGSMPLDYWFPASPNVKPQKANQYSLGYFRNLFDNKFETSVEAFYKQMNDVVDFKDHAQTLFNDRLEGDIRVGKARSYGVEFFVRKNEGRLTGWISYTLLRAVRTVPGINDGKEYSAPYNKPHTVNVILSYEFSKRTMLSANWIYSSGTPMTMPNGSQTYGDVVIPTYSERNGGRMRDYHRLDLSLTIKEKVVYGKLWQGEWVFSLYNAYGRHNDWMINFDLNKPNPVVRTYLPFVFFPGITYNFKF